MENSKYRAILLLLISCLLSCKSNYKPEIEKYVEFIKKENVSAKDYILKQWKQHDIVVFCERDHADMTQYALIQDVLSSEYFIKNVGFVFTEVGSVSVQNRVLKFLNTSYANMNWEKKH